MKIEQVRKALIKDFEKLYVPEFSATWEMERMVRRIEINLMELENVMKLFEGVK